jgi:two-component system sensor histidine kinase KdpD
VRTALLSAVSHDLRRPLAAAIAAVGGLRAAGPSLSAADHDELVATADESLAALAALVTDLLDVSRVQAGVLAVSLSPSTLREQSSKPSMSSASDPTSSSSRSIRPSLRCAPTRAAAAGHRQCARQCAPLRAARHARAHRIQPARTDRRTAYRRPRPGVSADRQDDIFTPFQRLGDTDNTTGLGLGLALSKGFTEGMGGTLTPETTPGGGLTMVVSLPVDAAASDLAAPPAAEAGG